jgi:TPR repeat protein
VQAIVKSDWQRAMQLFERAAELGAAAAHTSIADIYLRNIDGERSVT